MTKALMSIKHHYISHPFIPETLL